MPSRLDLLLDHPIISRVRRNHGLEHATIHMLSRRFERLAVVGRSDTGGFTLYGDVPEEAVERAMEEALSRLRAGEHRLAVHPNCGTNFLTAGLVAGMAAFASMVGTGRSARARLERLPLVLIATTLALVLTHPLGYAVQQRITTSGDMRGLHITGMRRERRAGVVRTRVETAG